VDGSASVGLLAVEVEAKETMATREVVEREDTLMYVGCILHWVDKEQDIVERCLILYLTCLTLYASIFEVSVDVYGAGSRRNVILDPGSSTLQFGSRLKHFVTGASISLGSPLIM
jgi:hypothetical protein